MHAIVRAMAKAKVFNLCMSHDMGTGTGSGRGSGIQEKDSKMFNISQRHNNVRVLACLLSIVLNGFYTTGMTTTQSLLRRAYLLCKATQIQNAKCVANKTTKVIQNIYTNSIPWKDCLSLPLHVCLCVSSI